MRHIRSLALLGVLVGLVAAGCGGGASANGVPSNAVAVVGGEKISKDEFNGFINQSKHSYAASKRTFPKAGSAEYDALQRQLMNYLVQRAEFAQKANSLGITISDKQVSDRLAQIKKQFFGGSESRYRQQLKQQGLSEEQVHGIIQAQLVSDAIFKRVTAGVKVPDKDVQDYYNAHKVQYGVPASRDVRHILVKTKAQADKIYAQLKAGGNFAALAKRFSQDPGSKATGGKLTVSKGQTVPPFDKVAFSLKTGELSPPVKTQFGWHIIQALSAVKPAKTTPFSQVKASIQQQLLQQKRNEAMTTWVNDTKKSFKVRYQVGYAPPAAAPTSTT